MLQPVHKMPHCQVNTPLPKLKALQAEPKILFYLPIAPLPESKMQDSERSALPPESKMRPCQAKRLHCQRNTSPPEAKMLPRKGKMLHS